MARFWVSTDLFDLIAAPAKPRQRKTALPALPAFAADPAIVKTEFIFDTAPFAACHASPIAETSGGLVAAWFGGTREKQPDAGFRRARFVAGKWTAPVEAANGVQPDPGNASA